MAPRFVRWFAPLALGLAAFLLASCSLNPARPPAQPPPPSQGATPPAAEVPSPQVPSPVPTPAPPRAVRLALSSNRVTQGNLVVLHLSGLSAEGEPPRLLGWEPAPAFVRLGQDWVALLPVSYAAQPGPRDITVKTGGQELRAQVTVVKGKFPESRVYVSQEKGDLLTDPQAERDSQRIAAIKANVSVTPLWQGPLLLPVKGELTTDYGLIRYVNDREEGRHSGLDLAAPAGTPVKAAAAGKVVLADKLVVTGYTVILDHGLGLFTSYSHMQSYSVRAGQSVAAGQVIGKVGATGLATGPHLHWTVSVGSTPTNPWPLLKQNPLN